MYNLNQSYSGGFLNYMDMKSINLAGASSKQLKQTLIDAAVALGKIKEGEVTIDNFDSTLKKKWADREVMERGFGDFAKLTTEVYKSYDAVRGVYTIDDKEYTTASEAIAALGTRYGELGYKALKSAQECKTFKEVVAATADAVSTQWLRIWKSIFGNYDEARELWTGLANGIYDTFVMPLINFRQRIESIMAFNPFQSIVDTINNSTIGEVAETVKNVTNSLEYYQEMKDKIWNGDYKNQPYRKPLLEEEGHNYEVLQSLVNKGYEYKLTMEDCIEAEEKFGIQIDRSSDNMEEVTQQLQKLSDQKLKDAGLTDAQIKQYHELEEIAKSLGKTVTEVTGRDLFIGSFRNIGEAISDIIKSITHAWHNVFHPDGKENEELNNAFSILQRIYKITELIRDRVKRLTEDIDGDSEGEKKISKLTRTLQGLFAILHLITSFIGAGFRLAFKVLEGVLSAFNISILDFTAIIGDAIYNFDRWVRENNIIVKTVKTITEWIIKAVKATKEWIDHNEKIQAVLSRVRQYFSDFVKGIKDWVSGLKEADNIPKYIFDGLVNGIKSFGGIAYNALSAFIIGLIELVKNLLGIHSPSLVFMAIGAMIMAGLWIGLKDGASPILEFFRSFWNSIIDIAKNMNIGNILAITLSVGFLYTFNKIVKTISNAVGAISSLTSAFKSIGDAVKNLSKALILRGVAEIIKGVGIALLALAGALYIISKIDANKVWQSVGVLASIAGILVILAGGLILLSKFTKTASVLDLGKTLGLLIAMVAAIYLMVNALKKLGKMDNFEEAFDRLKRVLIAMGSFVVSLIAVTGVAKVADTGLDALSKFLIKLSLSLLLIVAFMKLAGKLKAGDIIKGTIVMGLMALYLKAVNKMIETTSKSAYSTKSFTSFGKMALELGLALTLFAVALKIAGKLKAGDIIKGTVLLGLITGFIYALVAITKNSKIEATKIKEIHKIGLMVLELSTSMLIIAIAMKIIGMLTTSDIVKGTIVMIAFGTLVAALVAVINVTGRLGKGMTSNVDFKKIAAFMTSLSMSLLMLSGAIAILGMLKTEQLVKGVTAVGVLMLAIAGMMRLIGNLNMSFADAATIAILGTVITVISAMVIAFANQDPGRLLLGASVMTIILGVLGGILLALSKIKFTGSGSDAKTSIKKVATLAAELLILAVPLVAFVGVLMLMNFVDNDSILQKATALSILFSAMALIVTGFNKIDGRMLGNKLSSLKKIATLAVELTILAVPMAAFAGVLHLMNGVENPIQNATALALLIAAMSVIIVAFQALGNIIGKSGAAIAAIGALISEGLLAIMGLIAREFAWVLSSMNDVKNPMKNALALITLITAMSLIMVAFVAIGGILTATGVGILAALVGGAVFELLLAAMGLIAFEFAAVLNSMSDTRNAVQNAAALVLLIGALTAIMTALMAVGTVATLSIVGIAGYEVALLGLSQLIHKLEDVIGLLDSIGNIKDAANKMTLFTTLITVITKTCIVLASTGGRLLVADAAITALIAILVGFGGIATAVGAITDKIPALKDFADHGIDVFKKLAGGLGEIVGSLFAGLSSGLPKIGENLSSFINNAKGFIEGIKEFDGGARKGAECLIDTLKELIKENVIEKVSTLFTGGKSFARLGTELNKFADNMGNFTDKMADMDGKAAAGAKAIAECISTLVNANLVDNLTKFIGGIVTLGHYEDLGSFAKKFGKVGKGVKEFKDNLGTFSSSDKDSMSAASEAIKALADAAKVVNGLNDGNLIRAAKEALGAHTEDILTFAQKFGEVGKGVREYMKNIGGDFTSQDLESVRASADAIKALGDAAQSVQQITETTYTKQLHSDEASKKMQDRIDQQKSWKQQHPVLSWLSNGWDEVKTTSDIKKIAKDDEAVNGEINKVVEKRTMSIDELGNKLPALGRKIKDFMTSLNSIPEADYSRINDFLTALNYVKDLAQAVTMDGADKIDEFGKGLEGFPTHIKNFIAAFNDMTVDDETKKNMEYLSKEAPNWMEKFGALMAEDKVPDNLKGAPVDENNVVKGINIETLKDKLQIFKVVVDALKDIPDDLDAEKLTSVTDAMSKITSNEVKSFITALSSDDFKMDNVSKNMEFLGTALSTLSGIITEGMDEDKINRINKAIELLSSINELIGSVGQNNDTDSFSRFITDIGSLGVKIEDFVNKMKAIDGGNGGGSTIDSAVKAFNKLKDVGKDFDFSSSDEILEYAQELESSGQYIENFVNSLNLDEGELNSISEMVKTWVYAVRDELNSESSKHEVWAGGKDMMTGALGPLNGDAEIESDATKVGEYVVQGFINGMNNKSGAVWDAACAIAKKALSAMKETTKEQSPSKEAFKIGAYVDMGFINGMNSLADDVYEASYGVADQAMVGLTRSISNISAIIENDMDATPTIRPVLDLSDVEAGVGTLNSMMDNTTGILRAPTIGVFNNLGSISDTMNSRRQNGGEVVDAIDRLGKNLDNTSGDTYNINGIRVDSDEQITEAVSTLVRAARIDRRS